MQIVVHRLSFDACMQSHFFDGHDGGFGCSFSVRDLLAFIQLEKQRVHFGRPVFFSWKEAESCEKHFAEFVDVVAVWFCVFEEEFHVVHLFFVVRSLSSVVGHKPRTSNHKLV